MKTIEEIRYDLSKKNFLLSMHSSTRMIERNIALNDIIKAAENAEIIEDYPNDKYDPSCLILGFAEEKSLHLQVTRSANKLMKIITLYVPELLKWKNYRERIK